MAKNIIGKYQIVQKIGQGGMGAVYKAIHPTLKRYVILKQLILKKNLSINERFKREARIMLDLRNEHIVQVFDHFKEGGSYFIAMEFIDGVALDKLIKDKRYISNKIAILIFSEICNGLKFAHDRGVIHRDIKPANILISKEGIVKITDFGIATSKEDEEENLTKAGSTLGSPAFMSPEQIRDAKTVDKKADIYSMGVLLYNMVTGKLPFATNITPETILKIEKGRYVAPNKINPKIDPVILRVIKKAMHRRKNARYKDLTKIINIFKKYSRKYKSKEDICDEIKSYIFHKGEVSKKKDKKLSSFRSVFSKIALAVIIIGIGFVYSLKSGIFYEYLMPNDYGAVKIVVDTKKEFNFIKAKDIEADVYLKDDKNNFVKMKNINIDFKENKKKNSKLKYFESRNVYLKSDLYKIEISVKNEMYEKQIYIKPRTIQKKEEQNPEAKTILIKYVNVVHLPLRIDFDFSDIEKDRSIYNVDIRVKYGQSWIDWYIFRTKYRDFIVTGRNYIFEFSKKGYRTKYYQVDVDPFQNSLNIETKLTPVFGILKINSIDKGLKLSLNNMDYYYNCKLDGKPVKLRISMIELLYNNLLYLLNGKNKGKYADIQRSNNQSLELNLARGEHQLTVKKSSSISKTSRIVINENDTKTVNIGYNKKTKTINLDVK